MKDGGDEEELLPSGFCFVAEVRELNARTGIRRESILYNVIEYVPRK